MGRRPPGSRPDSRFQPGRAKIVPEPKGVVLIIAPWNYPVQLLLSPMAARIAAGNAVVAEAVGAVAAPHSAVLAELCPTYLDPEAVTVVEGGVDEIDGPARAALRPHLLHRWHDGSGKS